MKVLRVCIPQAGSVVVEEVDLPPPAWAKSPCGLSGPGFVDLICIRTIADTRGWTTRSVPGTRFLGSLPRWGPV